MNWLSISIVAYLLIALQVILDKFLLSSKKISHPAIYAFYSGVMSLFALAFFPFGFHSVSAVQGIFSVISGIVFIYGMLMLFFAINKSEASRVTPVVGAIIPVVTYFLSVFLLKEHLSAYQILGAVILIAGGIVISFNIPFRKDKKFFSGLFHSVIAGILLAGAFTLFKDFYDRDSFINVFIWTRFGLVAGAASLLMLPSWRKAILSSLYKFKKPEKEHKKSGAIFILNKSLGGAGSILINYAISLGSVTLVNALVSLEYVFILLLGIGFSHWIPEIFQEKKDVKNLSQKMLAIAIITLGIILISRSK